jgi:serine protease Do
LADGRESIRCRSMPPLIGLEVKLPEVLKELNAEMAAVIDGVRRSLVQITNGRRGAGAGTIWHSEGLILTNAHVARGHSVKVTLPSGRSLPARLLAEDRVHDLAALGVDATNLPAIELGDSRQLQPGQWVFALGHPWGVAGAVTAGVVTGVGARLPEMPLSDREWVAVSLHLRPGDSGGPLVDAQGRLVGINTMMAGPDIGLAVPVHVLKVFLRQALGA